MLLLNKALANTFAMGKMSEIREMAENHNRQSFPVEIFNAQDDIEINEQTIKFICGKIISDAGYLSGCLGIVLTDNPAIQALNLRYLGHDYPTDVISFLVECEDSHLEAEVVASVEVAIDRHREFGWDKESELMLYLIHGTLHQVGYDDQTEQDARLMRQREAEYLSMIGIDIPDGHA